MAEQDIFDTFLEERDLKNSGADLLPSFENGFITMREKTFVDTFDQQVQKGVQQLFNKFTLNEESKEDLKKGGEIIEGVGKGLFEGGVVNPLGLIINEDSKFMQDAKQATEFNPDFNVANFGYEGAKFFGAYLGLGKLMAIGKVGRQLSKLGTFGKEAARSVMSDFVSREGSEDNLVDAIMSMGVDPQDYPLVASLMTDPDDSDLEGRLKNVLSNLPLEALVPSIAVLVKKIKGKASPEEISQAEDDLKKQSNELLDQYSVGAAMNPEGDLAKSIIEEAEVNKSVSKLAPNKGEVVNLKPKVDRLNFYSKAEEVTNQLKQNKGTGQQYRQQLLKAGVKPDEIEWLGLDDVLNKGKINKQELQDQINANRIELDEVELGGGFDNVIPERFKENKTVMSKDDAFSQGIISRALRDLSEENYMRDPVMKYVDPETGYTITGNGDKGYGIFRSETDSKNFRNEINYNPSFPDTGIYSLNEAIIKAEEDMIGESVIPAPSMDKINKSTKFGEYTEPGGDNYREFLIKYENPDIEFGQPHFDDMNVIAHFRTKDRTTSDGKKVFYIEEIQSDWGQDFRKGKYDIEWRKRSDNSFSLNADDEIAIPKVLNEFTIDRILPPEGESGLINSVLHSEDVKSHNYFDWFKKTRRLDEPRTTISSKELYKFFLYDKGIKNKKGEVATIDEKLKVLSDLGVDATNRTPKAPFVTDTDKWTQLTLKRILSKAVDEGYDFVSITPGKAQMDRWNNEGVAKFYDEIVPKNAEKIVKKLDKNAIQKDKQIFNQKRFSIELTPQLKEKVKKGMAMFSATPLVVGQENE